MSLKRSIIFCESYVQLDNTLGIIGEVASNSDVVIIFAGTESITKYLKEILQGYHETIKVICIESVYATWMKNVSTKFYLGLNKVLALFIRILHVYKLNIMYLNKMKGGDIYFFCRYYNVETYFLIKKLIKSNKIHYIESRDYDDVNNVEKIKKTDYKIRLKEIALRLLLGNQIGYIRFQHGSYAPEISDNIYNKCNTYVGPNQRSAWLAGRGNKLIAESLHSYKVIFYDYGYEIRDLVKDVGEYEGVVKEVMATIVKHCSKDKIGIKNHPTFRPSVELGEYGTLIPNYIPGELVQRKDVLLVAVFSTCVYNAKCGVPISILNIINFKDDNLKKNFLNVAKQREVSGVNVKYPASIEDFEKEISEFMKPR